MITEKTIYFVSGLPRSGSTLLMNILGQNPEFYVTPTSGILDMLVQIRNRWDMNDAFRALPREKNAMIKADVMKAMLQAYFAHTDKPVCFEKNRLWCEYVEMAAALIGGADRLKMLLTVRDMRDVLASFELLYRETSAMGQIPQERNEAIKLKTAVSRLQVFIDNAQPVGRAFNAIRDAATRGWLDNILFIEYDHLCKQPDQTLRNIYTFLGQKPFDHDFEDVKQITWEDDFVHGFKNLHVIRPQVRPQPARWPKVFDRTVTSQRVWQDIERIAQFWREYL